MKPKLSLQLDLFYEEENNPSYLDTIKKYFDVAIVRDDFVITRHPSINPCFRTSLNIAMIAGYKFEFSDCMKWVPHFREHLLDPHVQFAELGYFAKYFNSPYDWPMFLRPCNGRKTFAGRVFKTYEVFMKEFDFLQKNVNVGIDLMCMFAKVVDVHKEWRLVFIDRKFIAGSQYMTNSERDIQPEVPAEVIKFGEMLAANPFFDNIFNFVIDIGERRSGPLHLIECNPFECSSFYGADLDKIYSAWAKQNTVLIKSAQEF